MTVNEIANGDVARYCKPTFIGEDGRPSRALFELSIKTNKKTGMKEKEDNLSFFLLNDCLSKLEQLSSVIKAMKKHDFTPKKTGFLSILNIENTKKTITANSRFKNCKICFKPDGLPHCELHHNHNNHDEIAGLLVECVNELSLIREIIE